LVVGLGDKEGMRCLGLEIPVEGRKMRQVEHWESVTLCTIIVHNGLTKKVAEF